MALPPLSVNFGAALLADADQLAVHPAVVVLDLVGLVVDTGRFAALRAYQHDVARVDRHILVDNSAGLSGVPRFLVLGHRIHAFHGHPVQDAI